MSRPPKPLAPEPPRRPRMELHVDWHEDRRYSDGGCWAIFQKNGHLFLEAAQKGKNDRTKKQLEQLCKTWNLWSAVDHYLESGNV